MDPGSQRVWVGHLKRPAAEPQVLSNSAGGVNMGWSPAQAAGPLATVLQAPVPYWERAVAGTREPRWGVGGGSRSRCPLSVGDHDTQRWGPFRLGGGRADARSRVFVVPVGLRGCCTLGLSAPPCPTLTPGHTCSEPVCPYCGDHLIPVTLRVVPVLKMFLNSQESWKYSTNDFPLNQSFT